MSSLAKLFNFNLRDSRPPRTVGIDIGSSAIKVVAIEERDSVLTLVTYGEVQLGPYADKPVGSVVSLSAKQEQAALVDVIRESVATAGQAVFAMPLAASFISTAKLQTQEDSSLSSLVRLEARKIIPVSLSEVALDWVELESVTDKNPHTTVLIAAIQNKVVTRFNLLMRFAGFTSAPTEIECFSANRVLSPRPWSLLIDFGAATTKLYIIRQGTLWRMHSINVGGEKITKKYAEARDLEFAEAEKEKIQLEVGDEHYATLQTVYEGEYRQAMREFKQVWSQYQTQHDAVTDSVYICGGAAAFAGLGIIIKESFAVDIEIVQPFDRVAYPAFMEDVMGSVGISFVPALGAALRDWR